MIGIHLADLHTGLIYKGIPFTPKIMKCVQQVVDECEKESSRLAYVVIHGDVVHLADTSPDSIMYAVKIFRLFDALGCPVFIIQGNHDLKTRQVGEHKLFDVFKEMNFNQVMFIDEPTFLELDQEGEIKHNLMLLPYAIYDDEEAIAKMQHLIDKSNSIIVCTHHDLPEEFAEYQQGSELEMKFGKVKRIPESLLNSDKVTKIINGHIHKPQSLGKIEIIGSIESFRFGEGNERFFLKVDLA